MATAAGYAVINGFSFEQLVWFCACAFIERDGQSLDVIDESRIEVLKDRIDHQRAEISRLLETTDEDFQRKLDEQSERVREMSEKTYETWARENAILEDMRQKIDAWQPPQGVPPDLKIYLLQQIEGSKHKAIDDWLDRVVVRSHQSRLDRIYTLRRELTSDEKDIKRVRRSMQRRRAWVAALQAAIPRPDDLEPPQS